MAITDKNDDGQVRSALVGQIMVIETPTEIIDTKSDLTIDDISDVVVSNVNGNIIEGSCTIETEDGEGDSFNFYADYELEVDGSGKTVNLQYSNVELKGAYED